MIKEIRRIFFCKKPKKAKEFNTHNVCHYCAWTAERSADHKGNEFYYCYYFDEKFSWEIDKPREIGFRLRMESCTAFHSIPVPTDMKRGAEFAKYFQTKQQIETSTRLSCYSIIIAIVSVLIAFGGFLNSCTKQNAKDVLQTNLYRQNP